MIEEITIEVRVVESDGEILYDIESIKEEFNKILFQLQQYNAEIEIKKFFE